MGHVEFPVLNLLLYEVGWSSGWNHLDFTNDFTNTRVVLVLSDQQT
jgi:hypothetical protein